MKNKSITALLILAIGAVGFLAFFNFAFAGTGDLISQGIRFRDPVTLSGLERNLISLTCWAYRVGALLLVIFVIWTGIRMMASGANPEKFSSAGKAFRYVLIGGLVFLGVGVIISTIGYVLGVRVFFFLVCF